MHLTVFFFILAVMSSLSHLGDNRAHEDRGWAQ